jgi:hypothetical protein
MENLYLELIELFNGMRKNARDDNAGGTSASDR